GAPVVEVASRLDAGPAERALDLREALRGGPAPVGLVYVCTPNNPTGHLVDEEELASIQELLPGAVLLVDRSFESVAAGQIEGGQIEGGQIERGTTEEGTPSGVLRVRGGPAPGRIEVRSLTKDFAVPGLRLGFALGDPDVLRACRAQIPPWSVSAPATAGALAAVEPAALEHLERTRRLWLADTAALFDGLAQRGFEAVRRSAPFGLVRVEDADAARRALLTRGVHVRSCASFGLPEHLRLSGRAAPDRAALFAALESSGVRPAPVRVEDTSRVETTASVEDVDQPRS
ncbi:MAG: aminotransferase class I/II-fold pyridoxal phosphate-dependent enzyme, partial [Planctomycetota bacterium]